MTPLLDYRNHAGQHKHIFQLYDLKGVIPFLAIIMNLSFWIFPLTVLALLKIVLPCSLLRRGIYRIMARIYYLAAWFDGVLLFRIMGIRLDVTGLEKNYPGQFYLIIANHQS
ncbi:MAG: hypothetical protein MUP22_00215, partial [Desulfobacterales bacterium]|nr:hypothetical protein [Desulfobacterales bacterium]